MKFYILLLAFCICKMPGNLYAQGYFDLNSKQNIKIEQTKWRLTAEESKSITIKASNYSKRAMKSITFEILFNDQRGIRLKTDTGYSKKISSKDKLLPGYAASYNFNGIPQNAQEILLSNVYVIYEDGSIENIHIPIE